MLRPWPKHCTLHQSALYCEKFWSSSRACIAWCFSQTLRLKQKLEYAVPNPTCPPVSCEVVCYMTRSAIFSRECQRLCEILSPIRAQSALATEIKYEIRSWLSGKHWRHHFMVMSSVRTPPALKKFPAMGFNYDDVKVGGSTGSPDLGTPQKCFCSVVCVRSE